MVSFSEAEWERVEGRMSIAKDRSFDSFARRACLDSEVKVVRQSFDPQELRAELARVGNNVNQIARQANIEQASTAEQVR
ncbi:plasmid mobilization relaxosome protein MobC, partial [Burkholderia multivorans]